MLRKILFWLHLTLGVSSGVVIFIMSITGVLLTYEKQLLEWDEARHSVLPSGEQVRLITDQVLNIARNKHPDEHHFYIRWVNEQGRPIPVWAGNQGYLISPYSGDILQTEPSILFKALHIIEDLHRWLALER